MKYEREDYQTKRPVKTMSLARMARLENDKDREAVEEEIRQQDKRYKELMRSQIRNPSIGH